MSPTKNKSHVVYTHPKLIHHAVPQNSANTFFRQKRDERRLPHSYQTVPNRTAPHPAPPHKTRRTAKNTFLDSKETDVLLHHWVGHSKQSPRNSSAKSGTSQMFTGSWKMCLIPSFSSWWYVLRKIAQNTYCWSCI